MLGSVQPLKTVGVKMQIDTQMTLHTSKQTCQPPCEEDVGVNRQAALIQGILALGHNHKATGLGHPFGDAATS